MKASSVVAPKKQTKEKPDLEEAIDESDEGEVVEEVKEDDEELDLSKDKYVKQPKKKAAAKKTTAGQKRARKAADNKESEDESDAPAPYCRNPPADHCKDRKPNHPAKVPSYSHRTCRNTGSACG